MTQSFRTLQWPLIGDVLPFVRQLLTITSSKAKTIPMLKMRGFTIVELMITILVLALLAGIGVPAFQSTVMNNRMTSQINALVTSMNQARSEAIKQNRDVVVCRSTDSSSCAGSGSGWAQGWLVFVDENENGSIDGGGNNCDGSGDCKLSVQSTLSGNIQVDANVSQLIYNGRGTSNTGGTFTFCDSRGAEEAKAIIISNTGRPRISKTKADGSSLTCA